MKYKIKRYWTKTETIKRDDRFKIKRSFSGNGSDSRIRYKNARGRKTDPNRAILDNGLSLAKWFLTTKKGFKALILLISAVWFISTLEVSTKPFNEVVEEVKAQEVVNNPLNGAKSFESADMPKQDQDLFDKYFTRETAGVMRAICRAESGLNPNAIGDTDTKYHSVGLCQIRLLPERGLAKEQMLDPEENVKYARLLFDKYGWKPWTAYKNGSYKKFLN